VRPKRPGAGMGGSTIGKCNGHQPPGTTGRGITPHPSWTPLDNRWTSLADWAREMAGSGRVSGAVMHVPKLMLGTRQGDAIANWMPGIGDHKPTVGRGR